MRHPGSGRSGNRKATIALRASPLAMGYGPINFPHNLREHLWARRSAVDFGPHPRRVALLAHRIQPRRATPSKQTTNRRRANKQHSGANKCSRTVLVFGRLGEPAQAASHCAGSHHNDNRRKIVMATQSYRERMAAARAEASAQRKRSKQRVSDRSSFDAKSTGWRWQR